MNRERVLEMAYGLTYEEAIEAIKKNYPPENYTMLREALDIAIKVLQEKANESK